MSNSQPLQAEPQSATIHRGKFEGEKCPTCDQPIPQEKSKAIWNRIEAQERKRERELKRQLADEKAKLELRFSDQLSRAEAASQAQILELNRTNKEQLILARDEATKATAALSKEALEDAEAKRKLAEDALRTLKLSHNDELVERLAEQKEALESEKDRAVNLANAAAFSERQKFEVKVSELQRQLQKKSSEELGEGAEVDLFESLKAEFPQDDIKRVKKGQPGADIIHKVIENGTECGVIVYDSKNRNAWRNDYVDKLRKDQMAAEADHAVLTTRVFPAGAQQLLVRNGVIVTNPARAVAIADILRKHVTQVHGLRLSTEDRDGKMATLYDFITSERFVQHLDQMEVLTSELLELDVKEKNAHDLNWKKRGGLVRSVQQLYGELSTEVGQSVSLQSDEASATG